MSSFLDLISEIYLPKGNGRVTLCRIQIQLRKKDKDNNSNYAIIKNQNDNDLYKKCFFEKIRKLY